MAYQVNKFNGVLQTTVADGTIDSSTDLRFVGKNYAGYGEIQNENFLHLMENFSNTTAPPKVIEGQIWYDSGNKRLKYYNGVRFKVAGGAEVSTTQPAGLATGEFWWDSAAKQLYAWSGTQYILVGPASSPELGSSAIATDTIKDNKTPVADTHAIIKIIAGGEIVAIVNALEEFVPASSTGLTANFPIIKQGITLINTDTSGVTSTDYRFWGTASNSDRLGGRPAIDYILVGDERPFSTSIIFPDAGYYVGDDTDLHVYVENEDVIVENKRNNDITVRITNGSDKKNVAIFRNTGVIPGSDAFFNLGSTIARWNTIYASALRGNLQASDGSIAYNSTNKTFTGSLVGNVVGASSTVLINAATNVIGADDLEIRGNLFGSVTGNVSGTATNAQLLSDYRPSVSVPTESNKSSVPIRDANGIIYATGFNGVSTSADRLRIDDSAVDTDLNYRSAKTTKTANSIAARNASGNLLANIFDGTATAAQYADLAEKYLADKEYEPGTVVVVGGEKEVTAGSTGQRAIGVVSTNPAFMMNKDLEGGTYIALKGRVPVKVQGQVRKGQRLIAGMNGTAVGATGAHIDVFAIALESSDDAGINLIEAVIL